MKARQDSQAQYFNKKVKDLKELDEGQVVRMKPFTLGSKVWAKGCVLKRLDERSYEVQAENGNIYRRNRKDIKPTNEIYGDKLCDKSDPPLCERPVREFPPVESPDRSVGDHSHGKNHNKENSQFVSPSKVRKKHCTPSPAESSTALDVASRESSDSKRVSRSGRHLRKPGYLKDYD